MNSMNLKPYDPVSQPPSGGPTTVTIMKIACEMPYTFPRFSSLECSAMNASKLGPTKARATAPIPVASNSHCHLSARIKGINPSVPKMLPMAIARKRPSESETQPPKICRNSGTICANVKNRPICAISAFKSFKYKGSKPSYMFPPTFAKIIAARNRISNPLNKGCFLMVSIFIL